jgi:pyruvate/2-oxoglutarate/acetoin dehydrogenase E1 component
LTTGRATIKDPFYRNHLVRDAIGAALYDAMKEDPAIHLFGEGAQIKMHYDAPQIEKDMLDRVHTLPISEDGNTNFAVGASLLGVKPVVDVITSDFLYRTFDTICNTAAKLNFVAPDGAEPHTIVIRAEFLLGGPTTGQRPEALFTHIPGLNVVVPSTPRDAYALMRQALNEPGVTLFFEDREIQDSQTQPWDLLDSPLPVLPFRWSIRYQEKIAPVLTVVTYGLMRQVVESVLAQEDIKRVEVIDLCTVSKIPSYLGLSQLPEMVKLLIVEPDVQFGGIGAEIVAQLAERLDTPFKVIRLGAPRETIPASRDGQARMLPSREQILEAIRGIL